jgi:cation/acetate symporter
MRFYTVPDAPTARRSVFYATCLIGLFYLVTFVLGFGATVLVGRETINAVSGTAGNMAAPMLAEVLGGTGFLGFISAVAFATILAVVAGLTLSGAAALAHDLWGHVVRRGQIDQREQLRVARYATIALALLAIALGVAFEGENVAFMVGLAFAIAASTNFPSLLLAMTWRRFTTAGAVASMITGMVTSLVIITLSPTVWTKLLGLDDPPIELVYPAIISVPASFAVAIIISLVKPEPESAAKFDAARRRMLLGADASTGE